MACERLRRDNSWPGRPIGEPNGRPIQGLEGRHCQPTLLAVTGAPFRGLDAACLAGDRPRLGRFPATAFATFFPCRLCRHSSRSNNAAPGRPPFYSVPWVRSDRPRSLRLPSRPRWARPHMRSHSSSCCFEWRLGDGVRDAPVTGRHIESVQSPERRFGRDQMRLKALPSSSSTRLA